MPAAAHVATVQRHCGYSVVMLLTTSPRCCWATRLNKYDAYLSSPHPAGGRCLSWTQQIRVRLSAMGKDKHYHNYCDRHVSLTHSDNWLHNWSVYRVGNQTLPNQLPFRATGRGVTINSRRCLKRARLIDINWTCSNPYLITCSMCNGNSFKT